MVNLLSEEWENVAEEVEPEDLFPFVEQAEEVEDEERVESYLCGAVKSLRSQRMKPDSTLCYALMFLAKVNIINYINQYLLTPLTL